MDPRRHSSFARVAAVAALCVLAAACDKRDDTTTASATGDMRKTPATGSATTADPSLGTLPPTGAGPATTGGALSNGDKKFLTDVAAGGMFEVQASQMAASKATDAKIKAFGEKLAKDHSSANDELKSFASSHSVTLPADLPSDKKAMLDKLSKASGADFDKQYVKMVGLEDHQKDIALFEKTGRDTKNPELKAWIDKTLPTLKEHHTMAKALPGGHG